MAFANLAPVIHSSSSSLYFITQDSNHIIASTSRHARVFGVDFGVEAVSCKSRNGGFRTVVLGLPCLRNRRRYNAVDTRTVENAQVTAATIEIPVTCYQILGVSNQAEKDEIVKSVMNLKRAEVEEGYTQETVVCRQELLMDVRDKLLFESEYSGNLKEKVPPKSSLKIPWAWLPAALCLLQEVGEEKLVLQIGRAAVQRPDAKPYIHDLLLSMALAECAIAKIGFEKNKISEGFEALARAQGLLRSITSLRKMTLLSQIEESLEELAPACTLELLGLPLCHENAERRRGAIAALKELLRQGLDVETSCQVQDWPCFLSQALKKMMASEIVGILPWDDLAIARKNKKSLESQNQRVVIDFDCFYLVLIAHIALGFSTKQTELIHKAKTICECLTTAESVDLKLEEVLCLFLLGQGNEAEVVEKLRLLESNSSSGIQNSILGKESSDSIKTSLSLEKWLKDAVFCVFPDTRNCSSSLANFFGGERKTSGIRKGKVAPQTMANLNHRSLATSVASEMRDFEDTLPHMNSSGLGPAVKQLAPTNLESPLTLGKSINGENGSAPVPLKRNLGVNQNRVWESWSLKRIVEQIIIAAVVGCCMFFSYKQIGGKLSRMRSPSKWTSREANMHMSSHDRKGDSSYGYNVGSARIKGGGIQSRMKKLSQLVKLQVGSFSGTGNSQSSRLPASISTSLSKVETKTMPIEEAEALVKQWQAIKSEALGPNHNVDSLSEALDESMLFKWQSLADAAKTRCCYWRFVLLQVTILRADILSDGTSGETGEIEALLEEAAELVDETQLTNPNYYSTYKVRYVLKRQDDGSWRFCESDIETPS